MATLIPIPNAPGKFAVPGLGKTIDVVEWNEQDIYDTAVIPAGAVLNTVNEVRFFTQVNGKSRVQTNLTTDGKVPARHSAIILKAGIFVQPKWGTSVPELADQMGVYQEGTYELLKNRKVQIEETHMWGAATGYGFVAYGVDFAAPAVTVAPGSNGVASPAAIPPLLVPFELSSDDDFEGRVRFGTPQGLAAFGGVAAPVFASHTLAQDVPVMFVLHGFLKAPATR